LSSENQSNSFKKWLVKYNLAVRLATLEDIDNRFRGETKFLALLNAIGDSGIEVLQSLCFDLERNDNGAHGEALLLFYFYKKIFNITKSHLLTLQKKKFFLCSYLMFQ